MFPDLVFEIARALVRAARRDGVWPTKGLAYATLALGTAGCGHFTEVASSYAHTQDHALAGVRGASTVAFRLCRANATQVYLQMRLGLGPEPASPTSWSTWYDSAPAAARAGTAKVVWSAYCAELDATGLLFQNALVALNTYGKALEALAEAKDFDASGLDQVAGGASTALQALGASDNVVSTAKELGSPLATLTALVADQVRKHELE